MGTITAQILIGKPQPDHGGMIPSHYLFLSENDRPAWILVPQDTSAEKPDESGKKITWIPTVENMLEDAMLMIGLHAVQDRKLLVMAESCFHNQDEQRAELYNDVDQKDLQKLYVAAREMENSVKIIVIVFEGSSIAQKLGVLEQYKVDIEVFTSTDAKDSSAD